MSHWSTSLKIDNIIFKLTIVMELSSSIGSLKGFVKPTFFCI